MLEWINRKITEKKHEKAGRKEEKCLPCNAENMKGRLEVLVPKMKGSFLKRGGIHICCSIHY
jgi:hypothetical protein